jgi:hypothetical protein
MKTSLIITSFVLAIAVVLVAGCTSLGSSGGSTPTSTAAGSTTAPTGMLSEPEGSTPTPVAATTGAVPYQNAGIPTAGIRSLTDAQQAEAQSLAEANATIKSALASGYTLYQVSLYDPAIPTATVQYMLNSNTELDLYIVVVDLSQDKVVSVSLSQHPIPASYPTQTPS